MQYHCHHIAVVSSIHHVMHASPIDHTSERVIIMYCSKLPGIFETKAPIQPIHTSKTVASRKPAAVFVENSLLRLTNYKVPNLQP
jgi:hypothetical protein